jgi:Uma2 family endonuclease
MGLARKLDHPATLADLEALPSTMRGEIIDGELYAFPRPRAQHADLESGVVDEIRGPFQKGRGGPGGWWILAEPGIMVSRSPEFSPDVAGWLRSRMPSLPQRGPITVVPDWACEVLSPGTRSYDLVVKRPFYADLGVRHLWYIDPDARSLTVSRLLEGKWLEVGVFGRDQRVRAEPFEAIEIALGDWWEGLGEEVESEP